MAKLIQESTPVLDALDEELDRTNPRLPRIYGLAFVVSTSALFWGAVIWLLTR